MKKILLIIAAMVWMALTPAYSLQTASKGGMTLTADSVLVDLPAQVLQLLDISTRMDMIDYYHNDSTYKATNLLGGKSWIETLTADYAKVHLTDVSWLEIKIFPLRKGGDVAAVSYTVDSTGEQADSELFIFDAKMRPLTVTKYFKTPLVKEFLHIDKGSVTKEKELLDMVQFPTIEYTFSPDDLTLTARLTVGQYMDVDDYNIFRLFLLPQLQYRWDGSRFSNR